MEIMSRSSLSSIFHHFFKSSWNPSEKINSINHDNRIFLFQEGLDLLYLVWIVNCPNADWKIEPHPSLDSLARHYVQPDHQPRPLGAEVSVPPLDVRAYPCSTNKVSSHWGRPAKRPAKTRLNHQFPQKCWRRLLCCKISSYPQL